MRLSIIILLCTLLFACKKEGSDLDTTGINLRQEMREFVINLSQYGKDQHPNFMVIPQNGIELISENGAEDGALNEAYLQAIDAHGQEDFLYGYNNDNQATPSDETAYIEAFLQQSRLEKKVILVTDYCSTPAKMDDSYTRNNASGYISFAADHRELDNIPNHPNPIFKENNQNITSIIEVKNFLYLINPGNYDTTSDFISALTQTNYDLIIMDVFFDGDQSFTASEINQLKSKKNGGTRKVVAYMSIGEAEDYRYYWQSDWVNNKPSWLDKENPNWAGNYKVKYWETEWQDVIYGNETSYLQKIIDAGFDGTYLDIISAYEYYE